MEIVLTPYGKNQLMQGDFDPVYYSFHDEGVNYSSGEYSISPHKSIYETPSLRPQSSTQSSVYGSVGCNPQPSLTSIQESSLQPTPRGYFDEPFLLGKSKRKIQSAPQLKFQAYDKNLDIVISEEEHDLLVIDLGDIEYEIRTVDLNDLSSTAARLIENDFSSIFPDNTTLYMSGNQVDFDIEFLNSIDVQDNFETEIWEIITPQTGSQKGESEVLFQTPPYISNMIIQGILTDDNNLREVEAYDGVYEKMNITSLSEFFTIEVDNEVDLVKDYTQQNRKRVPGTYDDSLSGPFGEDC